MKKTRLRIKGHEFDAVLASDSFNRRAQQLKNKIIDTFKSIGIKEDDVIVDIEPIAIKKILASASWYIDGQHLYYSYKSAGRYVDNLYVVYMVIEHEVNALINEQKTAEEFIAEFSESHKVEDERKEAREMLGVDPETLDMELITKKYKDLAKELHPDMPTGDTEKFKAINKAHKILKRELE